MAVEAIIQRVQTLDTKGGGYGVLLTTVSITDQQLLELMHGRGKMMRITFEAMQQPMNLGDDVNAGVGVSTSRVFETTAGDMVTAHAYASSVPDGACDRCGWAEANEVHEAGLVAAQRLIDDARDEPAEPTPEQAEARTALASRSRSNRNNGQ